MGFYCGYFFVTDYIFSVQGDSLEIQDGISLKGEVDGIASRVEELEIKSLLCGEMDSHSSYLSINSGAGGSTLINRFCGSNHLRVQWNCGAMPESAQSALQ